MRAKQGFTLVEMAVVLALLALMAHLAVSATGDVLNRRRARQAAAQMEELESAMTAFRRDVGRLPRALPDANGNLSLRELWARPDDMPAGRILRATEANLCVAESIKADLADGGVLVECGWRGPYLKLPAGQTRFCDPWGNPFENKDSAGFDRLFKADGAAAAEGDEVAIVRHYGSDGWPDARTAESHGKGRKDAEDGETSLAGTRESSIFAYFSLADGTLSSAMDGREVMLCWYAPCDGAITGGVETTTSEILQIGPLAPGEYAVRAHSGDWTNAVRRIEIAPGADARLDFAIRK